MAERYPECATIRVKPEELRISESSDGLTVSSTLKAKEGPLQSATLTFSAEAGIPKEVPYGGTGQPVWGGRFSCVGVDLNLPATVSGLVSMADGGTVDLTDAEGIVTCGSYGTIAPLA